MALTIEEIIRIQQPYFSVHLKPEDIAVVSGYGPERYWITLRAGDAGCSLYEYDGNHNMISSEHFRFENGSVISENQSKKDNKPVSDESDLGLISKSTKIRCTGVQSEQTRLALSEMDWEFRKYIDQLQCIGDGCYGFVEYLDKAKKFCLQTERYIVSWDGRIPVYGYRKLDPEREKLCGSIESLICLYKELVAVLAVCVSVFDHLRTLFQEDFFRLLIAKCGTDIAEPFVMGIREQNSYFETNVQEMSGCDIGDIASTFRIHIKWLIKVVGGMKTGLWYVSEMQQYVQNTKRFRVFGSFYKEALSLFPQCEKHFEYVCRILTDVIIQMDKLMNAGDIQKIEEMQRRSTQLLYGCPTAKIFRESDELQHFSVEIVEYE